VAPTDEARARTYPLVARVLLAMDKRQIQQIRTRAQPVA
jgi:hypothetical protein